MASRIKGILINRLFGMIAVGSLSLWLYYWGADLHRFSQGIAAYIGLFIAHFALYLLAVYLVLRVKPADTRVARLAAIGVVLVFAAGFRAQLADERPYLSSDTYRYVWDGRVQAEGINPYRYVPAAPELAHLREDAIYPSINRRDYAVTPYPPVAQLTYLLIYLVEPLSITAFKVAMSLFDLVAVLATMVVLSRAGMDPTRALILGWHPLLIWEGAHSGHVESSFIAFLALGLLAWSYRKPALTGVGLALAALTKFYPAMLLPVFMGSHTSSATQRYTPASRARSILASRTSVRLLLAFGATVALSYLPYLSVGTGVFAYLPNELEEEGYIENGTRYFLLAAIQNLLALPPWAMTVLAVVVLSAAGAWFMTRARSDISDVARSASAMIGLYLLLTTPRYPWYYAWMIPYLCFAPNLGWLYLTGATVLLYLVWYTPHEYPHLPVWLGAALYVPTLVFLVWERRIRQPVSSPTVGKGANTSSG